MMNTPNSTNQLGILPMWVIDRIKEEMRLGPAAWEAITAAVEQAEVPQVLPCEVKLPPGTVIGQGVPLSTLMLAIRQRSEYPAHAKVFGSDQPAEQHQDEPVAVLYANGTVLTKADCGDAFATCCKVETPLYTHADPGEVEQLSKIIRDLNDERDEIGAEAGRLRAQLAERATVIPKGFALVPQSMLLSKEVIGVINFHCGDTAEEEGGQFGQYTDGRLWVGFVQDDDGNKVHGLHIATDEYPEEGSTTLVEFPAFPGSSEPCAPVERPHVQMQLYRGAEVMLARIDIRPDVSLAQVYDATCCALAPFGITAVLPADSETPNASTDTDGRAEFETAYSQEVNVTEVAFLTNPDGSYVLPVVNTAYRMWKAGAATKGAKA